MVTKQPGGEQAVVIGAGIAGLAAARVLSTRFRRVTVVERDDPPLEIAARRGVPHGRHAHALLAAGQEGLERLFPRLVEELVAAGAQLTTPRRGLWHQEGGARVRFDSTLEVVCLSRPLLEDRVRARVRATPNIDLVAGARVRQLRFSDDGQAVVGVAAERDGSSIALGTDLVVDASGRNAPLLRQIEQAGFGLPPVSDVTVDMGYATRVLQRRPGDLAGWDFVVALEQAPSTRGGFVMPLEGDRWIVTLSGAHGDHPPIDPQGFAQFARSLPVAQIAELVSSTPKATALSYRLRSSQRRHFERIRRPPGGYVAIGDAICSFNPVYGQGMTSAVLQAEALGHVLDRHGFDRATVPRRFYRRAAAIVANPWRIAAGSDFNHPATTGPKPLGTDLINRYMHHVLRACHTSAAITEQMQLVQNLQAPPTALLRPDRVVRVLAASHRGGPEGASQSAPTC